MGIVVGFLGNSKQTSSVKRASKYVEVITP